MVVNRTKVAYREEKVHVPLHEMIFELCLMVVGGEKVNALTDESAPDYTDCVVGKVCEKGCLEIKKPILIKKED